MAPARARRTAGKRARRRTLCGHGLACRLAIRVYGQSCGVESLTRLSGIAQTIGILGNPSLNRIERRSKYRRCDSRQWAGIRSIALRLFRICAASFRQYPMQGFYHPIPRHSTTDQRACGRQRTAEGPRAAVWFGSPRLGSFVNREQTSWVRSVPLAGARSPEGGLAAAIASAGRHNSNVRRSYHMRSSCVAGLSGACAECCTPQVMK
jgi:hypothetical protein